ncbi:MAG TPA: hypothetical protein VM032_20020 [Vicinamibacterales bacterium]|nr:hypothetical protein [Vicinamibacterales bacterium]
MIFLILAMVIVSMFPWVLAALSALLVISGTDPTSERERPAAASYQPMRILTTRAPKEA